MKTIQDNTHRKVEFINSGDGRKTWVEISRATCITHHYIPTLEEFHRLKQLCMKHSVKTYFIIQVEVLAVGFTFEGKIPR